MRPTAFTLCIVVASFFPSAHAKPIGSPPPERYELLSDWQSCFLPVQVSVQKAISAYRKPSKKSPPIARLSKGGVITLLKAVTVVVNPGIAQVIGSFNPNDAGLRVGEQVYLLDEWEIEFYHAWARSTEVPGGLPVGNERAFKILRPPVIERWVMLALSSSTVVLWAQDDDALIDQRAIDSCTHVLH